MSSNVQTRVVAGIIAALAVAVTGHAAGQAACPPAAAAALEGAAADAAAGDDEAAAARLRDAYGDASACAPLAVASWSWHGWTAAARAGAAGGSVEALAAVRAALDVLEPGGRAATVGARYAAAVVHAAAAAAQDERDEMRVWIEHATGLAARLPAGARPWPLPPAVMEGELWLAVDDHAQAEAAFARALASASSPSPAALRGLARSRARRGDLDGGCAPFREALALVQPTRPDGPLAVEARAFLVLCK